MITFSFNDESKKCSKNNPIVDKFKKRKVTQRSKSLKSKQRNIVSHKQSNNEGTKNLLIFVPNLL